MSKPQHGDPQIDQKTIILTNALKEFNVTKYLRNADLSKLIELKSELERIGYVVEVIHRVPSNAYSFRADALRAQYAA